jgi:hypothetical protein
VVTASSNATPLDEAVWQAWVAKGRVQERRSRAARIKAVKWASIAGLLGAAGLWSRLAPFEVLVRFLVTASALVLIFQLPDEVLLGRGRVRSACTFITTGAWHPYLIFQAVGNAAWWL